MRSRTLLGVDALGEVTQQLVAYAPTIALFVGVVVAGLIAAALVRRLVVWAVERSGLDGLADRVGATTVLHAAGLKQSVAVTLGSVVWLAALLLTFSAATEILGLSAVTTAIGGLVAFLPRLLAAAVVMVGGVALASVLRSIVRNVSRTSGEVDSPHGVASLIYYVILTVSVLVAADQAGIETGLLDGLVMVCVSIGLAGVALAFALGSRGAFRNIVAGHYLRRLIHPGDEVEIEGERGVVVRFSPVAVVLRTERGQKIVPTRSLLDGTIEIVASAATATADGAPPKSTEASPPP